jgi:hypothetical protein
MLFVLTLAWTMCSELERGFKGYLPKNAGVRIPYGLSKTTQLYEWFFVYPMLFELTLAWTMCSELERGFKGDLPKNAGVRIPYGLSKTTQLYEWFFVYPLV